ncbi:MAG: phosphomannomutase/phosphoglucomutase, partial [bacterium]
MKFPYHVFRKYDIRGVYGEDITEDLAYAIGFTFGELCVDRTGMSDPRITVGMDARLHSPPLKEFLVKGLVKAGCRIVDLGMCPTPLVYYSAFTVEPDGFAMVTASHNPPGDNGFKLGIGRETIHSGDIESLGRAASSISRTEDKPTPHQSESVDIIPMYQKDMVQRFPAVSGDIGKIGRPVKVVLDSGNGTAGPVLPWIMKELGFDVIELFSEPDGRFPNHHPDPTLPEALEAIRNAVAESSADLGISFDGDADRIGVIDEAGSIIWGDMLLLLLAKDIINDALKRGGEAPIVISEVKASQVLYDEVEKMGGSPLMWKTGHSLIKAKMKETGAVLAGEMSGHMFFADRYFGYDDALYAGLRLAEVYVKALVSGEVTSFSGLLADVPSVFNTPEIRFPSSDDEKFEKVVAVGRIMTSRMKEGVEPRIRQIIDLDGVRVVFEDGWGLVRASNT